MSETNFQIKINVPMIKELVSDKIYRSDASAFREQYVNALSHGCIAYHQEYGYTDNVFVHVVFDYGARKVTITDNGMGMTKNIFADNFMSFGFSTVDKETNNTRSGMFGLGAISFFRIASACIVESWDRITNERFCFMTRNTDESEFVANRTLDGFGTRTEITLKEHVRISTLVEMVQTIANNYPVKTVLEVINSESEQTIATYNTNDSDSYEEFAPVMRFKDYVKKATKDRFVTLIDDDQLELYLSTVGGNKNHAYLCRIPIDISYSTGFTTYLNIKQEKIKGTDKYGKEKLQEVPKPDRDEVNEIANEYFKELIERKCDEMIYDIDIQNFEEYQVSDKRWVLNGYSIDDKLNTKTHSFIQKMRVPVRYRTSDGIEKRHETLLTLFGSYQDVMFHPSLHKGTFDAIDKHLRDARDKKALDARDPEETVVAVTRSGSTLVIVDDHCSQPIVDAKEYKKANKIKSMVGLSQTGGNPRGLLVRDGSWNNHRIITDSIEEINKRYPGGLYYADGEINANEIHYTSSENKMQRDIAERHKTGIIIVKRAAKIYPSIYNILEKIFDAGQEGKIMVKRQRTDKDGMLEDNRTYSKINFVDETFLEDTSYLGNNDNNIKRVLNYLKYNIGRYTILPIQSVKAFPFLKHIDQDILFMPAKFIHFIQLIGSGTGEARVVSDAITQLKYIPEWTTWDEETSQFVWNRYQKFTGRYGESNFKCRAAIMRWFVKIQTGEIEKPTQEGFDKSVENILQEHGESSYDYYLDYEKMFPTKYLESKAIEDGWDFTSIEKEYGRNEKVFGLCKQKDYTTPMEIDGKYCAVSVDEDRTSWKAVIDDDGNPQLVYTGNSYEIVKHKNKLLFKKEINKW